MTNSNLGVAATKRACPCCAQLFEGEIVFNTLLTKPNKERVEELHGKTIGFLEQPCEECQGYMEQGVIVVTIDPAKSNPEEPNNPYRTGGFFVVKDDWITRLFDDNKEMRDHVITKRMMFIEHEAADRLGLFNATT